MRSEEVGSLIREGAWVGESKLRRRRSEFVMDSMIRVTPCPRKCTCGLRVPSTNMCVEVSHEDVVIMEVKNKVKAWCEIGGTAGYRRDVNVINVDGDIIY